MDNNEIRFEGGTYSKEWINSFSKETDFLKECDTFNILKDAENRIEKLKELYQLVSGKSKK